MAVRVGRPRECQEQGHVCLEQRVCWEMNHFNVVEGGVAEREKTAPGQVNVSRSCFPWPCALVHALCSAGDGHHEGYQGESDSAASAL